MWQSINFTQSWFWILIGQEFSITELSRVASRGIETVEEINASEVYLITARWLVSMLVLVPVFYCVLIRFIFYL